MAGKPFIQIEDKELNRQIRQALARLPQETVRAVMDCALDLSGESAKRAPIETGDLRNNCHADLNGIGVFVNQGPTGATPGGTTKATATVGYSLPYALRQHEDLTLRHDRTDGYRRTNVVRYKTGGEGEVTEYRDMGSVNMVAGGEGEVTEYRDMGSVNMVAGGEAKYLERPFEDRKARYIGRIHQIVEGSIR